MQTLKIDSHSQISLNFDTNESSKQFSIKNGRLEINQDFEEEEIENSQADQIQEKYDYTDILINFKHSH